MSFSKILERCERLFIYLSLTLILLLESAFKIGIAVPTVTIEQKTALLLINFLLLFKIIDKKLILPQKSGVGSFADGIDHTFNKNVGKAIIYANDSAKYYQFISTKNCHIKDLTLFVFDKTSINKWMLLKSKGKIKQINVIELIDPPSFHYATVDSSRGMFGLFCRDGENIYSLGIYFFSISDDEGRQKLDDLTKLASSIKDSRTITADALQ